MKHQPGTRTDGLDGQIPPDMAAALSISAHQAQALRDYAEWLSAEAIRAGGIGPNERPRIWTRHILDSLAFALVERPPDSAIDAGTGVGLPGIPLAIACPSTQWTLIDRSQRRVELVRRATRVLKLDNVTARVGTLDSLPDLRSPYLVSRAVLPPDAAATTLPKLLESGGVAIVGLGRGSNPPTAPTTPDGIQLDIRSATVLDGPVWFLIMRSSS